MFDKPSSDSWNPRVSTVPSHGLYLYDIGYDEADLIPPVVPTLNHPEDPVEPTLELKKEIIKQRIVNRRDRLAERTAKAIDKIKNHELFRSNTK